MLETHRREGLTDPRSNGDGCDRRCHPRRPHRPHRGLPDRVRLPRLPDPGARLRHARRVRCPRGRALRALLPGTAADSNVLTVTLAETGAGPTCITRCVACTAEGRYPRLTADAAMRLVIEHRAHLDAKASR